MTRSGIKPSQHPEELAGLIALLQREGVKSYLEIGARQGDTFYEVMTHLPKGSKGVAVDLPNGPWGYDGTRTHLEDCIAALNEQGYECSALFGDSATLAIQTLVHKRGPYDAVLIDADHRYESVKRDFGNYQQRITALHDIDGDGLVYREQVIGVGRLWGELEGDKHEFSIHDKQRPMGIGVLIR